MEKLKRKMGIFRQQFSSNRKERRWLSFRHSFFDSNVLALKVDGTDEYAFLVNENNYGGDFK
jgi:hypothetical protein